MLTAEFAPTIPRSWSRVPSVSLRFARAIRRQPATYLLVHRDGEPILRGDVYIDDGWTSTFCREPQVWHDIVLVGVGGVLYVVDTRIPSVRYCELKENLGRLYVAPDYCLVTSESELVRLGSHGRVIWRANLAIDGVDVHSVNNGVVSGEAVMDPPEGIEHFKLDFETGARLRA